MEKRDLRSATEQELIEMMRELGYPDYRGRQLFRQAQALAAPSFAAMSDLPAKLREQLAENFCLCQPRVLKQLVSANQDTAKLLLEWADGEQAEMALMFYHGHGASRDRATCCVSSQTGCAMGCVFCATGLFRQFRNLSAGEIVSQVQAADALAREFGFAGVGNIVYMGMGEPLANLDEVRRSIELLNHEQGLNIGARRITISTCGLVPQIYQMADWPWQINLAVSLHSADDAQRKQLMPAASKWTLDELIGACRHFQKQTGRRVTCEYILIDNVNDSVADSQKMLALLTDCDFLVNIITANPVSEANIFPSRLVTEFSAALIKGGLDVQVRQSRGRDISAACGQLRKQTQQQEGESPAKR